ncbi:hypothetical protein EW146_g4968 [Bondarzewia mesenterica]|uniref:Pre-rRNA-processing protein TSR2 n=1 Tax=Bondarzewia mesenterica TaxID=1095465 RepID=A0A4S4LSX6_9AGAM|nr:hypothetical protein EW146_g4968 [Bondarzewia mesenterica]
MEATTSSTAASAPQLYLVIFARGLIARLTLWPALRVAVDNAWGGSASAEKRTWLASVLVDAFETEDPTPDVEYVASTLLQVMEDEFDVVLEDVSEEGVARDVVELWEIVKEGAGRGEDRVKELEERVDKMKGKKIEVEEVVGGDSDWEDEEGEEESGEDEAPQLLDHSEKSKKPEPIVDDDGFTLVQGKGQR